MKKYLLILIFAFLYLKLAAQEQINQQICYLNSSIRIIEPECVDSIVINNSIRIEDLSPIKNNSFELNFGEYNIEAGTMVNFRIYHKSDCKPSIRGKNQSLRGFYKNIKIIPPGQLKWETTTELYSSPFEIQQLLWGKWITILSVQGKGCGLLNEYLVNLKLYDGINIYRIKHKSIESEKIFSEAINNNNRLSLNDGIIKFTNNTYFEILDKDNNLITKGVEKQVDISKLKQKKIIVNFDNYRTKKIKIK